MMRNACKRGVMLLLCFCMTAGLVQPAEATGLPGGTTDIATSGDTAAPSGTEGTAEPSGDTAADPAMADDAAAERTGDADSEPDVSEEFRLPDYRGLLVAGSGIYANSATLCSMEAYKTPGEIDWELRGTAIEDYENFGIAYGVDTYINVRQKATTDSDVIGKLVCDNAVDILDTSSDGKWYKIKSGPVEGYVSSDYIKTGWEAKDRGREIASLQAIISTETLNVRSAPEADAQIWTQVDGNEHYDVVQDLGDWIQIELDTDTGYVASEYVTVKYSLNTAVKYTQPAEEKAKSTRDKLVAYALKWLGGKYVWGGETLGKGVDCSGFTKCVYAHFGIYLTHYTGSQAYEGTKISRSQLKPGDLVFYAKNGSINHVAIYIGDGQVVGARSKKRGICITSLDYRTPVRYVRVLD